MNNIKKLRAKKGILQTKLAMDMNLTQEAISSYETERVTPSAEILIKLADYFNTNIDYILCRTKYSLPINKLKPKNISDQHFLLLSKICELSEVNQMKVESYIDGLMDQ